MWPITLDMTRDECRGILRRLELETYSNIISTFRAQGGLPDNKLRLLEELRNIFHISQERHKSEARRAANDEHLCTIADTISGPNTTQEWSKEGRRQFPILPRSAPYTALLSVANGASDASAVENSRLPYPSETARECILKEENIPISHKLIVYQDPLRSTKADKIENNRDLKRTFMPMDPPQTPAKKRGIQSQQQNTVHTNTRIQQLYHTHSKTQSRHRKVQMKKGSKGRGSHLNRGAQRAANVAKIQIGRNFSDTGNVVYNSHSNKTENTSPINKTNLTNTRVIHSYASPGPSTASTMASEMLSPIEANTFIAQAIEPTILSQSQSEQFLPQIATSKKDITSNLTKLNQLTSNQSQNMTVVYTEPQIDAIMPKLTPRQHKTNRKNNELGVNNNLITESTPVTWIDKSSAGQQMTGSGQIKIILPTTNSKTSPNLQQPHSQPQVVVVSTSNTFSPNTNMLQKSLKAKILQPTTEKIVTIPIKNNVQLTSQKPLIPISPDASPTINTNKIQQVKLQTPGATPNKPKVQIISQHITPAGARSSGTPVKLPIGVQLKSLPGKHNVKIISAPITGTGKMVIKQASDNIKTGTTQKVSGIAQIKNISPATPTLHKVQLMPINKSGAVPTKTNVVMMQKLANSSLTSGTNPTPTTNVTPTIINATNRSISISKDGNFFLQPQVSGKLLQQQLQKTEFIAMPYHQHNQQQQQQQQQLNKNQNNVIVLDIQRQEHQEPNQFQIGENVNSIDNLQIMSSINSSNTNVITEDTPVDIIATPSLFPNPLTSSNEFVVEESSSSKLEQRLTDELKSIATKTVKHVKTVPTTTSLSSNKIIFSNADILNSSSAVQQQQLPSSVIPSLKVSISSTTKLKTVRIAKKNFKTTPITHGKKARSSLPLAIAVPQSKPIKSAPAVTDWEVELDQANKLKEVTATETNVTGSKVNNNNSNDMVLMEVGDNFNDVIEENDSATEPTIETATTVEEEIKQDDEYMKFDIDYDNDPNAQFEEYEMTEVPTFSSNVFKFVKPTTTISSTEHLEHSISNGQITATGYHATISDGSSSSNATNNADANNKTTNVCKNIDKKASIQIRNVSLEEVLTTDELVESVETTEIEDMVVTESVTE